MLLQYEEDVYKSSIVKELRDYDFEELFSILEKNIYTNPYTYYKATL